MSPNDSTDVEMTKLDHSALKQILSALGEGGIAVIRAEGLAAELDFAAGASEPEAQCAQALSPDEIIRARRTSILAIVRRLRLGLPEMRGRNFYVECPWHPLGPPSLRLDRSNGLWECQTDGRIGDGIELVRRALGVGYEEAIRWIAEQRSVPGAGRVT